MAGTESIPGDVQRLLNQLMKQVPQGSKGSGLTIPPEFFKGQGYGQGYINVIQQLIYFFNNVPVRDYLIQKCLNDHPGSGCQYMGTFFVSEQDDDSHVLVLDKDHHKGEIKTWAEILKHRMSVLKNPQNIKTLFTLAILYDGSAIHFVSFMYDPATKTLVSFDPGYNLYQNGSRVLIPNCIDRFVKLKLIPNQDAYKKTGPCQQFFFGRKYGVQYNGSDPETTTLPADAFCQSWSLFFVMKTIESRGDTSFVKKWCKITPKNRKALIMKEFFIPNLRESFLMNKFREENGQKSVSKLLQEFKIYV